MPRTLLVLFSALLLVLPVQAAGTEHDEALLQAAGLPADGPGLLAFLKRRAEPAPGPKELAELVNRMAEGPVAARKACADVLAVGPPAVPYLRELSRDPDQASAAALAKRALTYLENSSGRLTSAVVRLIAARRPAGAASVLLGYLPHADDDGVLEEVRAAMAEVAGSEGKADPAVVAALDDPLPLRRAVAIEALCQNGASAPPARLRKLLEDPMPSVRLRAALALAQAHDQRAIGTLINLLAELPLEQARQAEEFLADLAGDQARKEVLAGDAESRRRCRDAWDKWWKESEGPGLLEELRKRTLTEENRLKGLKLIKQLGDDDFITREKASVEIKALGSIMLPLLRQAAKSPDIETRSRIEACLSVLERDKTLPLSVTTARLVGIRKPAGATEAILGFIPFADEEQTLAELQTVLNGIVASGRAEPAVIKALSDPAPARRAAAAEALALAGPDHREAVRKLLDDTDPAVRLKTALALAAGRQKDVLPTLIALLTDAPPQLADAAEEYLLRVAQGHGPALERGDGEARKKRRDAWAAWWTANGAKVELVDRYPPASATSAERFHNCTVMVLMNTNQVIEHGPDGKVRWELKGLLGPHDAQVVGRDRVLVAEHNGQRVTERNLQGDVLWRKETPGTWPIGAQRLRNGNTFIVCRNQLLEVDRSGREVYSISRPANDICAARRLRDGQIVCVSNQRTVQRLDTTGKELKSYTVALLNPNGVDITASGNLVLAVPWNNRISEHDSDGKEVWGLGSVMQPMYASRLPNGGAIASLQQWPPKVVEVDREGKVVGEVPVSQHVHKVFRR